MIFIVGENVKHIFKNPHLKISNTVTDDYFFIL